MRTLCVKAPAPRVAVDALQTTPRCPKEKLALLYEGALHKRKKSRVPPLDHLIFSPWHFTGSEAAVALYSFARLDMQPPHHLVDRLAARLRFASATEQTKAAWALDHLKEYAWLSRLLRRMQIHVPVDPQLLLSLARIPYVRTNCVWFAHEVASLTNSNPNYYCKFVAAGYAVGDLHGVPSLEGATWLVMQISAGRSAVSQWPVAANVLIKALEHGGDVEVRSHIATRVAYAFVRGGVCDTTVFRGLLCRVTEWQGRDAAQFVWSWGKAELPLAECLHVIEAFVARGGGNAHDVSDIAVALTKERDVEVRQRGLRLLSTCVPEALDEGTSEAVINVVYAYGILGDPPASLNELMKPALVRAVSRNAAIFPAAKLSMVSWAMSVLDAMDEVRDDLSARAEILEKAGLLEPRYLLPTYEALADKPVPALELRLEDMRDAAVDIINTGGPEYINGLKSLGIYSLGRKHTRIALEKLGIRVSRVQDLDTALERTVCIARLPNRDLLFASGTSSSSCPTSSSIQNSASDGAHTGDQSCLPNSSDAAYPGALVQLPVERLVSVTLKHKRHNDAEYRALSHCLREDTDTLHLLVGKVPCLSCVGAIAQFRKLRPNVDLTVSYAGML
eukprot:GEMP01030121.1.p1 GENE.GEMP01030121.1~~GEMP01030121.1.p1  ORF type:complete len:619 (+),score=110.17 GEMP01030121.1:161-2017(+)